MKRKDIWIPLGMLTALTIISLRKLQLRKQENPVIGLGKFMADNEFTEKDIKKIQTEKLNTYKKNFFPEGTTWRSFWPIWMAGAGFLFYKMMKN